jgi:hypothetical protein
MLPAILNFQQLQSVFGFWFGTLFPEIVKQHLAPSPITTLMSLAANSMPRQYASERQRDWHSLNVIDSQQYGFPLALTSIPDPMNCT